MKEASLLSLLNEKQEKNHAAYHELFSSLNLSRPDYFDSLPETTESSYKILYSAGFIPGSIVDRLTETSLKVLVRLAKEDTSRIFLKDDIKKVAQQYGLKFLETKHYKGNQKQMFVDDLNTFQQRLVAITKNPYLAGSLFSSKYCLLGSSRAFDSLGESKFKAPLLFYYIGEDIYYLLSSHDSWIKKVRKIIYWPLASHKRLIVSWILLLFAYVSIVIASDSVAIVIIALLLYLLYLFFSLEKLFWTTADNLPLPGWFRKILYNLIPC